jgi:hypothetical protein
MPDDRGSHSERLLDLMRDGRVWRQRDIADHGISSHAVHRLVATGEVQAVRVEDRRTSGNPGGEGEVILGYCLAGIDFDVRERWERFALIAFRHPGAVLYGTSALRLHDMFDEAGEPDMIAVGKDRNRTTLVEGLLVTRWSSQARFAVGVEPRVFLGQAIGVTDEYRTALDVIQMASGDNSGIGKEHADKALEVLLQRHDWAEAMATMVDYAGRLGWRNDRVVELRRFGEGLRAATALGPSPG